MPFFVPRTRASLATAWRDEAPAALVQRLVRGDTVALDRLYRREADAVYRYALALCGNAGWAADATHDAFIALASHPQGYDAARGSVGAYLAGAARHALLAQWRGASRHEPWPDDDDGGAGPDSEASPEQLMVRRQDLRTVWQALRRLPWPQREAVVLVDLQGRDYAESARIAGTEPNTLRTRLHRGRLRLARELGASPGASR